MEDVFHYSTVFSIAPVSQMDFINTVKSGLIVSVKGYLDPSTNQFDHFCKNDQID